jgi:Ca2+-binding RTX toxin-like protein
MGTYTETDRLIYSHNLGNYSFHPKGRKYKIMRNLGLGVERYHPKTNLLSAYATGKAYLQVGTDDFTGDPSSAVGVQGEAGAKINQLLKNTGLHDLIEYFPSAKQYLGKLDLNFGVAGIVGIEGIYNHRSDQYQLQVSLQFEYSAQAVKNLQIHLRNLGIPLPAIDINQGIEYKGTVTSCAVTVPLSSLNTSHLIGKERLDLNVLLRLACYQGLVNNLSDVNTHNAIARSFSPFMSTEGVTVSVNQQFDIMHTVDVGVSPDSKNSITVHENKLGIGHSENLAVTWRSGLTSMDYFTALRFPVDGRALIPLRKGDLQGFSGGDSQLYSNEIGYGYRGMYIGPNADEYNARKFEMAAHKVLYDAYQHNTFMHPDNPRSEEEIADDIREELSTYLRGNGWENINQAPQEMQEAHERVTRSLELFKTNPYAAMDLLVEPPSIDPAFMFHPTMLQDYEFNMMLVDDISSLPLEHSNMMSHFNEMIADDPFEGQEMRAFRVPEEWQFEVSDDIADDSPLYYYYFGITDQNTIVIDNFEEHYSTNDTSIIRELPGYSEAEARFGSFVATQMYRTAIREYNEQRTSYSETQQSATVAELQTTTNEIKHEIVQGDNPGLAIYYQQVDPKGEISNFRYFYPDITDRNAIDSATLRYREEPLTGSGSGTQSLVRITERMIDGNWIHATTTEIRNYGSLTVIKESPADDPDHFNLDVAINFASESEQSLFSNGVTAGAIGAQLGSSVGNFVSGDEIWKQLTVSPLLSTLGENLAEAVAIDAAQNRGDLSDDVLDVFNNADTEFLGHLRDAAGGVVSSLVTAELMRAIDAEGIGADLAASVSSAVLGRISNNLITIGVNELSSGATTAALGNTTDLLSGVDINLVGNAVGSYIGSKLAEQALAGYDSEEEAIGAQIGGAAAGVATLFLVTSGPVGWLIAGLSSFAGNFLGGTLGDLIHAARPEKASAQLLFNSQTGEFEIGRTWRKRGGNIDGVKALANVAGDAMEHVLDIVDGDVMDGDDFSGMFLWKESRNIHGPGYFEKGSYFENVGGFGKWHGSVGDFNAVVEIGVIDMLGRLKIAGGDLYYKRALYNSLPGLMDEHQRPIEDPLQALSGNLQIATEYSNYLENKEVINALIQSQPDSIFAAGWIATLARAAELGLNRRHAADFYGGWRYLLEQYQADVIQSGLDYGNNQRLIGLQNSNGGVVLGDLVDPESKTSLRGSGVIDLRASTRELLGNLQRDGERIIDNRNLLPDELQTLRLEDDVLWLGDSRVAQIDAHGITRIYDEFTRSELFSESDFTLQSLAQDLAQGRRHLVDGQLFDVIAEIGDDGSLTLMTENEVLDGARLQGGELIREGGVIARVNEDGAFVPTHGEDIDVSAVVHGSEEADIIYSGDLGNDIFAGAGNDTVHGGANADWIHGGEGDDTLHAGDTDGNALFGEAGDDELHGGAGSDWFEGGEGDDRLYGGDGGDVLQGDRGSDYLEGGLGGDHYVIRRGDGDTVIADHGEESETSQAFFMGNIIQGITDLNSPSRGGDNGGGETHDTLSFGPSITLDDLTYERLEDDLVIQIASGDDETQETVTLTDWFTDEGRIEVLEFATGIRVPIAEIEQFINGTAGEDLFTLEEIEGRGLINAMAGDDTIDLREAQAPAEDGHLPIEELAPNLPNPLIDVLEDRLTDLVPILPGGEGNNQGPGHVVNGGDGNDTVHGSMAEDILRGGMGDDWLAGNGGSDVLLGRAGSDSLAGNQGNDTLLGGTGDDELSGGAGADYLWGGSGEDQINGGAGSDTFEFGYGDGQDSLNDSHQYEPDDPDLTTLLASIDGLLTDETTADDTTTDDTTTDDITAGETTADETTADETTTDETTTNETPAGLIITDGANSDDAVLGEAMTDDLLSLIDDLQSIVDAGAGDSTERITESLEHLSKQLEANKLQMNRERLEPFIREFRYLALDTAGLLDTVN